MRFNIRMNNQTICPPCCCFIEPALWDWMNHQPAVIMWADEGHCGHITLTLSGPVHSVGKPKLNPDHHSEHNAPKGGYLIAWVTDQGFVLSPFFFTPTAADSSIHSIRSELFSPYLPFFPPFLFLSLNNGQSHINTQGSFHRVYSPRWPHYPRVFCLFVPLLKKLNWAAGRGGLQGEEVQKRGWWGSEDVALEGDREQGTQGVLEALKGTDQWSQGGRSWEVGADGCISDDDDNGNDVNDDNTEEDDRYIVCDDALWQ